ncbi:hypothetical protein GJAV_G00209270 [Gymnothorax javanicus]|nr:hypothetical protein GJAV_G00209270 [Gymnothorax javanicus]
MTLMWPLETTEVVTRTGGRPTRRPLHLCGRYSSLLSPEEHMLQLMILGGQLWSPSLCCMDNKERRGRKGTGGRRAAKGTVAPWGQKENRGPLLGLDLPRVGVELPVRRVSPARKERREVLVLGTLGRKVTVVFLVPLDHPAPRGLLQRC